MAEQTEIPAEMLDATKAIEPILIEASVTDIWGGSKLAEWQRGNSLTIDCTEEMPRDVLSEMADALKEAGE